MGVHQQSLAQWSRGAHKLRTPGFGPNPGLLCFHRLDRRTGQSATNRRSAAAQPGHAHACRPSTHSGCG